MADYEKNSTIQKLVRLLEIELTGNIGSVYNKLKAATPIPT
jgi:hypothetical protein